MSAACGNALSSLLWSGCQALRRHASPIADTWCLGPGTRDRRRLAFGHAAATWPRLLARAQGAAAESRVREPMHPGAVKAQRRWSWALAPSSRPLRTRGAYPLRTRRGLITLAVGSIKRLVSDAGRRSTIRHQYYLLSSVEPEMYGNGLTLRPVYYRRYIILSPDFRVR